MLMDVGSVLPWGSPQTALQDQGTHTQCGCTTRLAGLPVGMDPACPVQDQQSCRASAAANIQNS